MRANLILLPAAIAITALTPAHAEVYMTIEQAQAEIFPGATFTKAFRTLTKDEARAIERASHVNVRDSEIKAWRVSGGGWFIADEVVGKHDFIPFALGIDANGAVKGIEILEYREAYGSAVRGEAWRAQFTGKTAKDKIKLGADIKNISGATLSSKHVTDGVRRLMATYELVLAN